MIFLVPFDIIQILTCTFLGKQLSTSLFFHHPLELEPGFDSNKRSLTSVYSGIAPTELEGIIEIQPKIRELLRVVAKYTVCTCPLKKKGSIGFFINFSLHKKGIDFAPYPHVTDQQNEAQRGCVHPSFASFLLLLFLLLLLLFFLPPSSISLPKVAKLYTVNFAFV